VSLTVREQPAPPRRPLARGRLAVQA